MGVADGDAVADAVVDALGNSLGEAADVSDAEAVADCRCQSAGFNKFILTRGGRGCHQWAANAVG